MKRMAVLILAAAAVAGCASAAPKPAISPQPAIPTEFRAACGHPGAQVEVILRDNDIVLVPHLAISLEQVREDDAALGRHGHAPNG